ncbi:hypothetical protein [Enhygromyxa salina]|uniref:Uncharacterized protein n=1 Tax=Enhygromyxa salina TaxID=215803 RepID=A0A2S9YA77_9BACT|nr:hypothetical protein [Enhygromyxa salina]PRQ02007.1 hypothetical protein ENSA7_56750 [Enhygromyxa salina]
MAPTPTFEHLTLRVGELGPKLHGSPLTPPDAAERTCPTHQTWFAATADAVVGALEHDGELHLATGAGGRVWQIDAGQARELQLNAELPELLRWTAATSEPSTGHLGDRRNLVRQLRWARHTPIPGQRLLLVDGLNPDIAQLPLNAEPSVLLEALRPRVDPPSRWRRLLGAKSSGPSGAALVLDCIESAPLPDGFTPWLRALEQRGMHLDWSGNEAGNYPLPLFELPPPSGPDPLRSALLGIARDQLERASEDAWADWPPDSSPTEGYEQLVSGQPQRGWWRDASHEELVSGLELRGSEFADRGTPTAQLTWSRSISGGELLGRLQASVQEICAVAVSGVPDDECVVVWYLLGGVSRTSGKLEVVALERVWS